MFTKRKDRMVKAEMMVDWINGMNEKYPKAVGCKCELVDMPVEAKMVRSTIVFAVSAAVAFVLGFATEFGPSRGLLSVLIAVGLLLSVVAFAWGTFGMFWYTYHIMIKKPCGPLEFGCSRRELKWLGQLLDEVNLSVEEYLAARR